jgi:hypothetical protein
MSLANPKFFGRTLIAALVLGSAAGLTQAASAQVIHTCYNNRTGNEHTYGNLRPLRPGQSCPTGALALSWNGAGPTGVSGTTGAAGSQGTKGVTGVSGAAGVAGATGVAGASGPKGASGSTGAAGPTGPAGVPGATGSAGPTGPSGTSGPTGPAGPTYSKFVSTPFQEGVSVSGISPDTMVVTLPISPPFGGNLLVQASGEARRPSAEGTIIECFTVLESHGVISSRMDAEVGGAAGTFATLALTGVAKVTSGADTVSVHCRSNPGPEVRVELTMFAIVTG